MKLRLSIVALLLSLNVISQEEKLPAGWDKILLSGKTAYMNLVTGEVSKTFPKKAASKNEEVEEEFDPTIAHQVKKGETLSTIARAYDLTLAKLYQLNNMSDFDSLEVGQEVVIGYAHNLEEKQAFLEGNVNVLKHNHETLLEKSIENGQYHKVASGDTLYSIATRYKLTVNRLKELNKLSSNMIKLGQKLRIQ